MIYSIYIYDMLLFVGNDVITILDPGLHPFAADRQGPDVLFRSTPFFLSLGHHGDGIASSDCVLSCRMTMCILYIYLIIYICIRTYIYI